MYSDEAEYNILHVDMSCNDKEIFIFISLMLSEDIQKCFSDIESDKQ